MSKEQEVQLLQAELEARTKEMSEKVEQIHQQVRKDLKSSQVYTLDRAKRSNSYLEFVSNYDRGNQV